ncbi:MAG: hypothetical protein ABI769_03885 [Pseudomonadota bacterium]
MKSKFAAIATGAVFALLQANSVFAQDQHYNKSISMVEVPMGSCYFFQLTGVTESDPQFPGIPWFAISNTQANAKEMYAMLLTVRANGGTLQRVLTSGATACGAPQVLTIDF